MIVVAILIALTAIYFAQDNGEISQSINRRLGATVFLAISGYVFYLEYGILKSVFILIGLISLLGTLFTLLRYKISR